MKHPCQRAPCYFAWGCFRYFGWEREPRRKLRCRCIYFQAPFNAPPAHVCKSCVRRSAWKASQDQRLYWQLGCPPRRIVGCGYRPSPLQGALVAQMPIWQPRILVPLAGIEPALLAELDFESSASTNSATGAYRARPGRPKRSRSRRNIAGGEGGSTRSCQGCPEEIRRRWPERLGFARPA